MRVGILSIVNPTKGLWRDTECMLYALPDGASIFGVARYADRVAVKALHPASVPAGTTLAAWLKTLDVMIVGEALIPQTFQAATSLGVRIVYIPNLDWAALRSTRAWLDWLRAHPEVTVVAKSEQVQKCLADLGVPSTLVPWSIPDEVVRDRVLSPKNVRFYMNAGYGGWKDRRGVDIAVKAWRIVQAECPEATFTLKTLRPSEGYKLDLGGIDVCQDVLPREALTEKYQEVDVVIYPSRWEGFGLSLLEALHAGLPAIATDGWPMNEMVEHEHNGLLVPTVRKEDVRLAPQWECDVQAFADAMIRIAKDHRLRRRLTCPQPGEIVARQNAFCRRFRAAVEGKSPPICMVAHGAQRSARSTRMSPLYWVDSLRNHGYEVLSVIYNSKEMLEGLKRNPDFVLAGKVPESSLKILKAKTTAPVVVWHHDLVDYDPTRRKWANSVQKYLDLYLSPEPPDVVSGEAFQLMPGCRLNTDRGPGKRAKGVLEFPDDLAGAVFFGNHLAGNRKKYLNACASAVRTDVFGSMVKGPWASNAPMSETLAAESTRKFRLTLSISATCTQPGYTSIRLFNACGAGGAVLAENFEGIEQLYPLACVLPFRCEADLRRLISDVLADNEKRKDMRVAAEEWTYRHHTWDDRVDVLLEQVGDLL